MTAEVHKSLEKWFYHYISVWCVFTAESGQKQTGGAVLNRPAEGSEHPHRSFPSFWWINPQQSGLGIEPKRVTGVWGRCQSRPDAAAHQTRQVNIYFLRSRLTYSGGVFPFYRLYFFSWLPNRHANQALTWRRHRPLSTQSNTHTLRQRSIWRMPVTHCDFTC